MGLSLSIVLCLVHYLALSPHRRDPKKVKKCSKLFDVRNKMKSLVVCSTFNLNTGKIIILTCARSYLNFLKNVLL